MMAAIHDGSLGHTIKTILSKLKPEAAYFAPVDGKRAGMLFLIARGRRSSKAEDREFRRPRMPLGGPLNGPRLCLDEAQTDALVADMTEAEEEAIDLYHFTSLLNRALGEDGRRRVVEMMWEIANADGHVSEFESNLIWRAAEISSRERLELGRRVAEEHGGGQA
jgi:hypothetical protein